MTEDETRARSRFMALQLVRLSGAAMVFVGLLIVGGRIDLPRAAGYVLTVIGIVDALIVPIFLTRSWRSPRQ